MRIEGTAPDDDTTRDPATVIVIPTYDEADNIRPLVARLLPLAMRPHIVIVDDDSPDGTGEIADELAAASDRVHVIHRERKLGLGGAHIAGMQFALAHGAEHVITMDADFSHEPRYLPDLVAGMGRHDVMIGSRYVAGGGTRNWGLGRRMLSRGANVVARAVLRLDIRDCTGAMRCYRRGVLEEIAPHTIESDGYSFMEEIIYRCARAGFRIGETPIVFEDRRVGRSKISRKEVLKAVWTLVRLRWGRRRP